MCWNAEVSLNTFLFSTFVLLLIMYNNTYTQYKILDLNNKWVYLLFFLVFLVQLMEFFIWKNIKSPFYNRVFTTLNCIILLCQPIASIMLLTNSQMRNYFLLAYCILAIPFISYRLLTKKIVSIVSDLGHLRWNMLYNNEIKLNYICLLIWVFFLSFPLLYSGYFYAYFVSLLTLLIVIYNYYKDKSIGSMWCWVANSMMIYYAVYLLFYLPFFK